MSGEPPSGAQVSPDGRWWWDGTKWLPMPGVGPDPQSARQPPAQLAAPNQQVAPPYPGSMYVYGPKTNGSAVASLVFGIISWFLCPVVGGILAIVLGHVARGQIRRTGEGGGGQAMAGLVLGYAHLAASFVFFLFWILVFGGLTALLTVIGNLPSPTPTP